MSYEPTGGSSRSDLCGA